MTNAQLQAFRRIAAQMAGETPTDWEWVGQHMSQRMFGITQERAEGYAARHGGTARRMPGASPACYTAAENRNYADRLRNPR